MNFKDINLNSCTVLIVTLVLWQIQLAGEGSNTLQYYSPHPWNFAIGNCPYTRVEDIRLVHEVVLSAISSNEFPVCNTLLLTKSCFKKADEERNL